MNYRIAPLLNLIPLRTCKLPKGTYFSNEFDQDPLPQPPTPVVRQIRDRLSEPVTAAFIAGGVAGAVSRTIVSPLERLKILLQIQSVGRTEYKLSIWKALVKIGKEEGWKGYMRGNGTNCIRIVPYSAVQFGSYSFYRRVRLRPFISLPSNIYSPLSCLISFLINLMPS